MFVRADSDVRFREIKRSWFQWAEEDNCPPDAARPGLKVLVPLRGSSTVTDNQITVSIAVQVGPKDHWPARGPGSQANQLYVCGIRVKSPFQRSEEDSRSDAQVHVAVTVDVADPAQFAPADDHSETGVTLGW